MASHASGAFRRRVCACAGKLSPFPVSRFLLDCTARLLACFLPRRNKTIFDASFSAAGLIAGPTSLFQALPFLPPAPFPPSPGPAGSRQSDSRARNVKMAEYTAMKVPDLKKLLGERGIPQAGNKADLIARLVEDDKKKAAPAAPSQLLVRIVCFPFLCLDAPAVPAMALPGQKRLAKLLRHAPSTGQKRF